MTILGLQLDGYDWFRLVIWAVLVTTDDIPTLCSLAVCLLTIIPSLLVLPQAMDTSMSAPTIEIVLTVPLEPGV